MSTQSERIAEGIIRSQEVFRAKNHKPDPRAQQFKMDAQAAEQYRLLEKRIKEHTNNNVDEIFGEGK
mgnify:CR=1 FL=1|tara:strand:+ start:297 stop:497 length:201 start_codon:yes stop_codon:yes gene_type:complete